MTTLTIPLNENFTSGTIPTGWTKNKSWEFGDADTDYGPPDTANRVKCAWIDFTGSNDDDCRLMSPQIQANNEKYIVQFDYYSRKGLTNNVMNELYVEYVWTTDISDSNLTWISCTLTPSGNDYDIPENIDGNPIALQSGAIKDFLTVTNPAEAVQNTFFTIKMNISYDDSGSYNSSSTYLYIRFRGEQAGGSDYGNNLHIKNMSVIKDTTWPPLTKNRLVDAVEGWIGGTITDTTVVPNSDPSTTYGDINNWDVSNVTDMSGLFKNKTTFNSNISNWNVSNVTNMSEMFSLDEMAITEYNKPTFT